MEREDRFGARELEVPPPRIFIPRARESPSSLLAIVLGRAFHKLRNTWFLGAIEAINLGRLKKYLSPASGEVRW